MPSFLDDLSKLDKSIKDMVEKKLERIRQNPRLSKPLGHLPNFYSERSTHFRIVFEVRGEKIILYRICKRDLGYDFLQ